MSKNYEFKHWQVNKPVKGVTEFRAPSTQGAITVSAGTIVFAGNLTNITGDEQREVPEVFIAALAHQSEYRAEREQRAATPATEAKPRDAAAKTDTK